MAYQRNKHDNITAIVDDFLTSSCISGSCAASNRGDLCRAPTKVSPFYLEIDGSWHSVVAPVAYSARVRRLTSADRLSLPADASDNLTPNDNVFERTP